MTWMLLLPSAVFAAEPKHPSDSQILLLRHQDSRLANFFGRDLRQADLTRNSDGSFLYFQDGNKFEIDVFATNGLIKTIGIPSQETFINDAGEIIAWKKDADYYFKNGTVLHRPKPGWEDIKASIVRTDGRNFYLKDGTVTNSIFFPTHQLWMEYSGKFCVHEVGNIESIYEIGTKTNRLITTQTNFWIWPRLPCIFLLNGEIFLFGQRSKPQDKGLSILVFSPQGTNCVLKKDLFLPDVDRIKDMDFSSERIIAVHPRDYIGDVFYLYDLSNETRKRIGTGYAKAIFLQSGLKDKVIKK